MLADGDQYSPGEGEASPRRQQPAACNGHHQHNHLRILLLLLHQILELLDVATACGHHQLGVYGLSVPEHSVGEVRVCSALLLDDISNSNLEAGISLLIIKTKQKNTEINDT